MTTDYVYTPPTPFAPKAPFTIPHSDLEWSAMSGPFQYRISTVRGTERIWRKEHNPAFYGGYQIKYIQTGTRVANEWIANATRI